MCIYIPPCKCMVSSCLSPDHVAINNNELIHHKSTQPKNE